VAVGTKRVQPVAAPLDGDKAGGGRRRPRRRAAAAHHQGADP